MPSFWLSMPHQLPRQHWDSQRSWAQELEPWCLLVLQLHELTLNLSVVVSAVDPGAPGHGKVPHGTLDLPTKERTWAWGVRVSHPVCRQLLSGKFKDSCCGHH